MTEFIHVVDTVFIHESKELQRQNAIFKFLKAEKYYLASLQAIVEGLMKPIQSMKILTESVIHSIFCNIEAIFKHHQQLAKVRHLNKNEQTYNR